MNGEVNDKAGIRVCFLAEGVLSSRRMVGCQCKFLPEKCSRTRPLGPLLSLSFSASAACSLLFRADAGAAARC